MMTIKRPASKNLMEAHHSQYDGHVYHQKLGFGIPPPHTSHPLLSALPHASLSSLPHPWAQEQQRADSAIAMERLGWHVLGSSHWCTRVVDPGGGSRTDLSNDDELRVVSLVGSNMGSLASLFSFLKLFTQMGTSSISILRGGILVFSMKLD